MKVGDKMKVTKETITTTTKNYDSNEVLVNVQEVTTVRILEQPE